MAFLTVNFAAFFAIVLVAFWISSKSRIVRTSVLILASYFFFANWNPYFLVGLALISVLDYFIGKKLGGDIAGGPRKLLLGVSLAANLGLLAAFKFLVFFPDSTGGLAGTFGAFRSLNENSVAYPIGLSFFLFQSISYTVDVYRRKIKPCASLPDYLLYVSFFPRLLAGPIVRAGAFLPQLEERPRLSAERRGAAIFLVLTGVVKKVVFADYLALNLVDKVFDLPQLFSTTEVILSIYAYAVQIYCEFSGYTDLALAFALLLGIELPENFRFPYLASNLREFWRRWFVSLSAWFRDYVYVPMGGGRSRGWAYVTPVVTMILVGLWNGPAWTYLLWGLANGLALAATRAFHDATGHTADASGVPAWRRAVGAFFTFHFVAITWALYRSADLDIFKNIFMILRQGIWGAPNLSAPVVAALAAALAGVWFPPGLYEKARRLFLRAPLPVQLGIAALIFLLVFQVQAQETVPFVYERF